MIQYLYIGGGLAALAALLGLVAFAYKSGRNAASVSTANSAKNTLAAQAEEVAAMAQAQADKPVTEDEVFARLDKGTA